MIHPVSRTIEWMKQVAAENKFPDIALIEKSIRAFSLLESLVLSGCPFVFKGGTALIYRVLLMYPTFATSKNLERAKI